MIIETVTAIYQLDEVNGVLRRYPRDNALGQNPPDIAHLRKDTQAIPYRMVRPPIVGHPMMFVLDIRNDGVATVRTTTMVIAIDDRDLGLD
jgi:hypothetical protein